MRWSLRSLTIRRLILPVLKKKPPRDLFFKGLDIRIVKFTPTIITSEPMPKAAFYAVTVGRKPGIYTTWAEAEAQVKGFPSAKHKKFSSEADAQAFLQSSNGTIAPYNLSSSTSNLKSRPSIQPPVASSSTTSTTIDKANYYSLPSTLRKLAEKGYWFTPEEPHRLIVYTDGSSLANGKLEARAGLGVWWSNEGEAKKWNLSERLPGKEQTNNRGELLSIVRALEKCPFPDIPLEIRTDSMYSIQCMTVWLPKWLKNGFKTGDRRRPESVSSVKNADLIKHLLVLLRRRAKEAPVKFKYVPGHKGVEGNEGADRLAKMGSNMAPVPDRTDWLDPDTEDEIPIGPAQIDLEIDEDWLMSPEEAAEIEKSLGSE